MCIFLIILIKHLHILSLFIKPNLYNTNDCSKAWKSSEGKLSVCVCVCVCVYACAYVRKSEWECVCVDGQSLFITWKYLWMFSTNRFMHGFISVGGGEMTWRLKVIHTLSASKIIFFTWVIASLTYVWMQTNPALIDKDSWLHYEK